MKLVLYSGGQTAKNEVLHQSLADLCGSKKRKALTYIPFCSDGSKAYYERAIKRYQRFGFSRFNCLHADRKPQAQELIRAFDSDAIYLAGGNTFYLLHHLRESRILPALKRYGASGGVLAGLSAGAIILTPNIELAAYPAHTADENDVGLRNLKALGLAPFEFFPHYQHSLKLLKSLERYAERSKHPVFAVEDGSGIVVEGRSTRFYGGVRLVAGA